MSIFAPNARLHRTRRLAEGRGVRGGLYRSQVRLDRPPARVRPGQFFMVRPLSGGSDPLLPRALSALTYDADRGVVDFCYRVYGAGTALLASLARGAPLQVHGPYGNGFALREVGRHRVVLVGGGVGVPPLYFLAQALAAKKVPMTLFQGARTQGELLLVGEFRKLGVRIEIATDDASRGFAGTVGALFGEHLAPLAKHKARPLVYVCGPHPMMKDVAARALGAGFPCRVSLEERMACGTGICLGCVVAVERGQGRRNLPTCTQGPVFDAAEVCW